MEEFVSYGSYWKRGDATAEPCFACGELIMSNSYSLFFRINEKEVDANRHLCESCYETLKNEDGI